MSLQDSEPTPEVIAHKFAESYYGMLVQEDTYEKLASFYDKNAVVTRGDEAAGHKSHVTTTGPENIKKELQQLHKVVRNCQVKLTVMDSQRSVGGGVLVTVIGAFIPNTDSTTTTNNNNNNNNSASISRRFVQTFFLAAENESNYYIRNDILRYLADPGVKEVPMESTDKSTSASTALSSASTTTTTPTTTTTTPPSSTSTTTTTTATPTTGLVPTTTTATPATTTTSAPPSNGTKETKQPTSSEKEPSSATKKEEKEKKKKGTAQVNGTSPGKAKQPPSKEQPKEKESVKSATTTTITTTPSTATSTTSTTPTAEPKKPQTWAGVVGQSLPKDNTTTVVSAVPLTPPLSAPGSIGTTTQLTSSSAPVSAGAVLNSATTTTTTTTSPTTSKTIKRPRGRPDLEIDLQRSLYVGNLPFNASPEKVKAIFTKYGNVLNVSLMPRGYGFIDFATPQDVQNVLKAVTSNPQHFTLDQRPLIVQERHPDNDGSSHRGPRRPFGPRSRRRPPRQ